MKNNNVNLQQNWIKANQTKFFFLGFIVGIVPYCILIGGILKMERYQNLQHLLYILLFIGILTAIGNGFSLRNQFNKKVIQLKEKGKAL